MKYALLILVGVFGLLGTASAGSDDFDLAPTRPKQSKVPQVRNSTAKSADNFNISSPDPAPCTGSEEDDENCIRQLPLGVQKKQSFSVFSRSPMEKMNETLYSKALGDQIIKSTSSPLISASLVQNYVNPAMAAAAQNSADIAIKVSQARDIADMTFFSQLETSEHGTMIANSYKGCINTWLRTNKGGTYSEAQENCMGANSASAPTKPFAERPDGNFQGGGGMTTGYSFFDYPGLRNVKRGQSNLFSDDDERKGEGILLTSILFNPEIQAALDLRPNGPLTNREASEGVRSLRDSFRILIGDYKWKIEDRKAGEYSFQKIAPSDPAAASTGLWGLKDALYKQAYHTIFAIEYGHCLVSAGQSERVLTKNIPESDFWMEALDSSELWVSGDSKWFFYKKEEPLRLNRKTLVQHFASLSVGPFIFDRNREGDLWTSMKDRHLNGVINSQTDCDVLKSWELEEKTQAPKRYVVVNLEKAISELASAIADAQMYSFFNECLRIISAVSNTVLDQGMKDVASGLILSYVNYQDIGAQYNDALNRIGAWSGVINQEAQNIRSQGLSVANNVKNNGGSEKRN